MKKNIGKSIVLAIMIMLLAGCVKFNANMDIKKDKSMDFSIIYAVNTTYLGEDAINLSEEDKKELEESGYKVSDYSEDSLKGYKLVRNIKNIDTVSSTENKNFSLSGILEEEKDDKLFKVKKGFIKNTYTANFDFSASDSGMDTSSMEDAEESDDDEGFSLDDEMEITTDDETGLTTEEESDDTSIFGEDTTEDSDDMDYEQLAQTLQESMDLSFNVTLPYPALSNNATKTSDDNKSLSWSLASDKTETLEFQFELYNMTNIYLAVGAGVGFLVILIVIIVVCSKKKKKNVQPMTAPAQPTSPIPEMNMNMPQQPQPSPITPVANNGTMTPSMEQSPVTTPVQPTPVPPTTVPTDPVQNSSNIPTNLG